MTDARPRVRAVMTMLTLAALGVGVLQFYLLRHALPTPDALMYFQVADQIQRVGYRHALPVHWSPLYPLFVLVTRLVLPSDGVRELTATSAGDAVLLVGLCLAVVAVFASLARMCWPDDERPQAAWVAYAGALALFCAFALLRVGLRLPDALVTSLVVAALWAWGRAFGARLDLRWALAAGLCGGLSYLARSNLLHWSLVVAMVACAVAPGVALGRRFAAFAAFGIGLLVFVGPQIYVLSTDRGEFTYGETGKLVFSESYGATYPNGYPAWPLRKSAGDVRIFTEKHVLNVPGFYDPGREMEDAIVAVHWWVLPWSIIRGANICLFGNWAPSFTLMWPLLWGLWPVAVFDLRRRTAADDPRSTLRRRVAWLLILAGSAGFAMHLLSFCIGYYMPPYVIALFAGATLLVLDVIPRDEIAVRYRACYVVACGFAIVSVLWTLHYFRAAERRGQSTGLADAQTLGRRLAVLPAGPDGLRRIAVAGNWSGLYAARLSGSQVLADLPDVAALHDPARWASAVRALREEGVTAVLIERGEVRLDDPWRSEPVTSTWSIVDIGQDGVGDTR